MLGPLCLPARNPGFRSYSPLHVPRLISDRPNRLRDFDKICFPEYEVVLGWRKSWVRATLRSHRPLYGPSRSLQLHRRNYGSIIGNATVQADSGSWGRLLPIVSPGTKYTPVRLITCRQAFLSDRSILLQIIHVEVD